MESCYVARQMHMLILNHRRRQKQQEWWESRSFKENSFNTKGLRETCGERWIELKTSDLIIKNICLQRYASKQWNFGSFSVHSKNQYTMTSCKLNVVKYDYFHNFFFIFQAKAPSSLFHFLFFLLFLLFFSLFSFLVLQYLWRHFGPRVRIYLQLISPPTKVSDHENVLGRNRERNELGHFKSQ